MRLEDSEVTLALMDRLTDSGIDRLLLHCNGAGVQEPRIWMRWTPVTKGRARQGPGFGHLNHPEKKEPPTERYSVGGEWLPVADLNCGPSD